MTFKTSDKIKQLLEESKVYSIFIDGLIGEIKKAPAELSSGSLPLNDPIIQKAVNEAFTPAFLQTTTEKILDGTYNWLSGKTSKPDFVIDYKPQKLKFAEAMGDYAVAKFSVLPLCSRAQLLALGPSVDAFKATCRPANFDVLPQRRAIIDSLMNSPQFLTDTTFTVDDIKFGQDTDKRPFYKKYQIVPKIYSLISLSPQFLYGGLGLLGIAMVLLNRSRRDGLSSLAFALGGTGIFLAGSSYFGMWVYQNSIKAGGNVTKALGGAGFQNTISQVLEGLIKLINTRLIKFGIVYAALGGFILLMVFIFKKRGPKLGQEVSQPQTLQTDDDTQKGTQSTNKAVSVESDQFVNPPSTSTENSSQAENLKKESN